MRKASFLPMFGIVNDNVKVVRSRVAVSLEHKNTYYIYRKSEERSSRLEISNINNIYTSVIYMVMRKCLRTIVCFQVRL